MGIFGESGFFGRNVDEPNRAGSHVRADDRADQPDQFFSNAETRMSFAQEILCHLGRVGSDNTQVFNGALFSELRFSDLQNAFRRFPESADFVEGVHQTIFDLEDRFHLQRSADQMGSAADAATFVEEFERIDDEEGAYTLAEVLGKISTFEQCGAA